MELRYYPDPILLTICNPVEDFEKWKSLFPQMQKIMNDNNGCGLAAPQIGINERIFIYSSTLGFTIVINPEIVNTSPEMVYSREGCLSIPNQQYQVKRYRWIEVVYYDLDKNRLKKRLDNFFEPIVFQHEYDHLDGILINF